MGNRTTMISPLNVCAVQRSDCSHAFHPHRVNVELRHRVDYYMHVFLVALSSYYKSNIISQLIIMNRKHWNSGHPCIPQRQGAGYRLIKQVLYSFLKNRHMGVMLVLCMQYIAFIKRDSSETRVILQETKC
jgi:hypothetical protein